MPKRVLVTRPPEIPRLSQLLDRLLQVLGGDLEAHAAANLATAVGIPGQYEVRALLEHEERAVGVLPSS